MIFRFSPRTHAPISDKENAAKKKCVVPQKTASTANLKNCEAKKKKLVAKKQNNAILPPFLRILSIRYLISIVLGGGAVRISSDKNRNTNKVGKMK